MTNALQMKNKRKDNPIYLFFQNDYLLILNLYTLLISRLQSICINSLFMQFFEDVLDLIYT